MSLNRRRQHRTRGGSVDLIKPSSGRKGDRFSGGRRLTNLSCYRVTDVKLPQSSIADSSLPEEASIVAYALREIPGFPKTFYQTNKTQDAVVFDMKATALFVFGYLCNCVF